MYLAPPHTGRHCVLEIQASSEQVRRTDVDLLGRSHGALEIMTSSCRPPMDKLYVAAMLAMYSMMW